MGTSSVSPYTELENEIKDVGNKLLTHTSSIVELLTLLDKAETLLSRVAQVPSRSMGAAILPVMKALIRPELISHSEIDVKASVASCLHEIIRITAPNEPYAGKIMEEIFKLTVMLFKKLSLDAGHAYKKAVSVLERMAGVRSCIVMLDIEVDELIVEMFQLFLNTIRPHHSTSVLSAMETIMTLVIDEIEEIPFELLAPLLFSTRKGNQNISPLACKLGENVFKKCATKLKPCLPEGLRLSASDVNDYVEIVSSMCQEASAMASEVAVGKEHVPDATCHRDDNPSMDESYKPVVDSGIPQLKDTQTPDEKSNGETTEASANNDNPSLDESYKPVVDSGIPQLKDTQTPDEKSNGKTIEASPNKAVDIISNGHQSSNSYPAIAIGEDKRVSPSQNHFFSEGSEGNGKTIEGSANETEDISFNGHQSNIYSAIAHGEDKSATPSQNHSFSEGSERKRGRPKKSKDPIIIGGDALKEPSGKTKVSFSASRSQNDDASKLMKSSKADKKRKQSRQKQEMKFGEELIGRKVKVWWPIDRRFYDGVVYSYNPVERKHRVKNLLKRETLDSLRLYVLYTDGEEELLDLHTEIWEIVAENNLTAQNGDASKSCGGRKDEAPNEYRNSETAKSIGKAMSSKDQSINVYGEGGSSGRKKTKRKKSESTNSGGDARKRKKFEDNYWKAEVKKEAYPVDSTPKK